MTTIDAKQAAEALSDIDSIAHRVRRSTTYKISSLVAILWGVVRCVVYRLSPDLSVAAHGEI
jgi:hypothetical protein